MKIAVTSAGDSADASVDSRFGRASYFIIYDTEKDTYEVLDNIQNLQSAQGAGIQAASHIVNAGCEALITGHCGPKAFSLLSKGGVGVYSGGEGTVSQVIQKFKDGELSKSNQADVEAHW